MEHAASKAPNDPGDAYFASSCSTDSADTPFFNLGALGGNVSEGCILLGEIAARTPMLDVACRRCPRRGRLSMARLLAEHGPGTPVPEFLATLMATCGKAKSGQLYDRCGAHFPQLPALFP